MDSDNSILRRWYNALLAAHDECKPVDSLTSTIGQLSVDQAYEVQAMVDFDNIFGIGFIEGEELIPGEILVTRVNNAYDPGRYFEEYGPQPRGRCYMVNACTASYMDLVYGPEYPNGIGTFVSKEVACRSVGDSTCRFVAESQRLG